jgi:hypothetical protein
MPEVVLRHPNLPGQPYIVDVPVGGFVDVSYRQAGWEIDPSTSAMDARAEQASLAAKVAEQTAADVESFVPAFAPDDAPDAAASPEVLPVEPAAPAVPSVIEPPSGALDVPEGE